MRSPHTPFLELGFYFAAVSEAEALLKLVTALLNMGAIFTGEAYAHLGENIQSQPFAYISDELLEPIRVNNLTSLHQQLDNPHIRLIQVHMRNATATHPDVSEIITYVGISQAAAAADHHPVSIWTDGEIFSGDLRQDYADARFRAGRQIYQRFCALVEAINPSYAAITSELPLMCPVDLRRDPDRSIFRDFFVNRSYCDVVTFNRIQELFRDAYIETLKNGVYISSTEECNPRGININITDAVYQSVETAKLIASISE